MRRCSTLLCAATGGLGSSPSFTSSSSASSSRRWTAKDLVRFGVAPIAETATSAAASNAPSHSSVEGSDASHNEASTIPTATSSAEPKTTATSVTEGEQMLVTILKMDHPHRHQRVMIVPTPRIASKSFYKDWCYQPYVRDHQLRVSNDIFNPAFVAIPRLLVNTSAFKAADLHYYTPIHMPDAIDNNTTRREFVRREQTFNTFVPLMMMTTNGFRDAWHPWIARKTRKLVGERYLTHPKEDQQSFVVLVPPAYAASMANTLQTLGFRVADTATVPAGSAPQVKKLLFWGDVAQFAVLSYFWIVIAVIIVNESIRLWAAFREYQIHLITVAGKDPKDYGF